MQWCPRFEQVQAHLICLTENLLLLLRYSLEIHENIRNEAEIKRRQQRLTKAVTEVTKNGGMVPLPLLLVDDLTDSYQVAIGVDDGELAKAPWFVFQKVHARDACAWQRTG